jgi:chitosanase
MYADANGTYSEPLCLFLTKVGVSPLAENKEFKQLLWDVGRKDPVMQRIQDEFFERRYFQPAMQWATSWLVERLHTHRSVLCQARSHASLG